MKGCFLRRNIAFVSTAAAENFFSAVSPRERDRLPLPKPIPKWCNLQTNNRVGARNNGAKIRGNTQMGADSRMKRQIVDEGKTVLSLVNTPKRTFSAPERLIGFHRRRQNSFGGKPSSMGCLLPPFRRNRDRVSPMGLLLTSPANTSIPPMAGIRVEICP